VKGSDREAETALKPERESAARIARHRTSPAKASSIALTYVLKPSVEICARF
jgi:hypothetical protein